jgi:hypothetical protein
MAERKRISILFNVPLLQGINFEVYVLSSYDLYPLVGLEKTAVEF